jgi:predicted nucleotidyltransferase
MKADEVIATLRANEAALRARGVAHAALFGSRARGDAHPGSDIDIMIELEPGTAEDIYSYVGLKRFVAGLFSAPVDVVDRSALKAHLRPPVESQALYAF